MLRLFVLALSIGAFAAVARAQDEAPDAEGSPTDPNDAVAKGLFQAGAAAFDAGEFAEALEHFQAAYARSPRPKLLYNIGQAADRLRQDEVALDAFRRYLNEVPDAKGRDQIEARVRVLEQAVAERKAAESAAAPPEDGTTTPASAPEAASQEPAHATTDSGQAFPWAPVVVLSVGVVAMVAGSAFGMTAKSEEDDYARLKIADATAAREAKQLLDDAQSHATLSNMLLGAGAALSAVSAVWLVLVLTDDGADEHARTSAQLAATPRLAPGELSVVLSGRFGGAL